MKVTRFDESKLFGDLDKIDAWLTGRGFTQRNRLRIYRENLIAMRDTIITFIATKFETTRHSGRRQFCGRL